DAADEVSQIRQCGLGKDCNLGTHDCLPATDGRECAPCQNNDDCRRGAPPPHPEDRCVVNNCATCPFKGESFCASPCADDAACATRFGVGFVCVPVADTSGVNARFCIPQRGTCHSGLGRLGDGCEKNGAADCLAGVCL